MTREEAKDYIREWCPYNRQEEIIKALEQEHIIDKIRAEINSPNRGTCDYFIVDRIEEIINKYKKEGEQK